MVYTNLSGQSIAFGQSISIDLDKNGRTDIWFMTEQVAYDFNTKVKNSYLVVSGTQCNLAADTITETTPHLERGANITQHNLPGHSWYNVLSFTLMQKVTAANGTYWEGNWLNVNHKYLPIQVTSGAQLYTGWIEISTDTMSERVILHRAALCRVAQKSIQAGL